MIIISTKPDKMAGLASRINMRCYKHGHKWRQEYAYITGDQICTRRHCDARRPDPLWDKYDPNKPENQAPRTMTETRTEFWRESEQKWVPHVFIRTQGPKKDNPTRWRHRTITTAQTVGPWKDGRP